jgi:hypothetical protein
VTPELIFRTRKNFNTEDLALLFMEEEVGRFDWKNNWEIVKQSGEARQRIENWLMTLGIQADSAEIIAFLDNLKQTGRWS